MTRPLEQVNAADRDAACGRQCRDEQERRREAGEHDVADGVVLLAQVRAQGAVAAQDDASARKATHHGGRDLAGDGVGVGGRERTGVGDDVERAPGQPPQHIRRPVEHDRRVLDRLRPRRIVIEHGDHRRPGAGRSGGTRSDGSRGFEHKLYYGLPACYARAIRQGHRRIAMPPARVYAGRSSRTTA